MIKPLVLHVVTRMGIGGVPTQVTQLIRTLQGYGYPAALAVGRCTGGEVDMSYLLRRGDPVIDVSAMQRSVSPLEDLRALRHLVRIMKETRPLIVHTHTAKAGFLGRVAARIAGVPIVVHTFHGNVLSGYFPEPVSKAIRLLERGLALITNKVCVVSAQQAGEIAERFHIAPAEKVHVLPIGMKLDSFAALPQAGDGRFTVGWLGRLAPVKNVPLLIETIGKVLRRTDRVQFLIAGDGPDRPLVEAAVERFGRDRVEFLGWQRDTHQMLERCHLLLQTSRNEGTPVSLIQGMAARRPFVSTAVGGVVDLVHGQAWETNGARWYANGILTREDSEVLADSVCQLSLAPRVVHEMGAAGREFVRDRFSQETMIENTVRLYDELTGLRSAEAVPDPATQPV